MKVIPWTYAHGKGEGYQLIMSGHRQYNVVWEYGANEVVVQVSDHSQGWQEHKRVSIPGDYKGKPHQDIREGMREHMRTICSGLTREWEGWGGMSVFREEWAMHNFYEGQKVRYSTMGGGQVLGVVKGTVREGTARTVKVRVTSRNHPHYKCGEVLRFSPTCPWLKSREV